MIINAHEPAVRCAGPACRVAVDTMAAAQMHSTRRHPITQGWLCSDSCQRAVLGNLNGSIDGGSAEGRAKLAATERAQQAQYEAQRPRDVVIQCAGWRDCHTEVRFAFGTSAARIAEYLDTHNWTRPSVVLSSDPASGGRPVFVGGETRYAVERGGRFCGVECASQHPHPKPPPPPEAEPAAEPDEEIVALLNHRLGSPRPQNVRGAAQWEAREQFIRGCVLDQETVRARLARLGPERVVRSLRGEEPTSDEAPPANRPEDSEEREGSTGAPSGSTGPLGDRYPAQQTAPPTATRLDRRGRSQPR
jgi:hypothetical protein